MLTSSSPWLFAGCHVLLRQSVPGHPPCALISLITFQKVCRPLLKCCFAFPLYCLISLSRSLALCSCQGAYVAIPENDIVSSTNKPSSQLYCAGLAPAVELHPADAGPILILLLDGHRAFSSLSHLESTLGYELRQEFMSP